MGRASAVPFLGEEAFEAIFSELARLRVLGLGDAIGVEEEKVARAHLGLAHSHLHGLEQAHRQAAARQSFNRAAGAADQRREMAATAIFDLARVRIIRRVDTAMRPKVCPKSAKSGIGLRNSSSSAGSSS
jgi:hypothetical protein